MIFTPKQEKVLQARNHNILVSAAAGSGKTAVLVERIIRLITEGDEPLDIDRLLVVTFTRAAAAQMRERIAAAISARLEKEPMNEHLQMQETLLHKAQITTMDSFFTFLLHNHFSDIDLDPGFRQMDQTESDLMRSDVLERFLEEQFAQGEQAFLDCAAYFCPSADTRPLEDLITKLYNAAMSHPYPEVWLEERCHDYEVRDEDDLFTRPWMQEMLISDRQKVEEILERYETMARLSAAPDGPVPYSDFLEGEKEQISDLLSVQSFSETQSSEKSLSPDDTFPDAQKKSRTDAGFYRQLYNCLSLASGYSFASLPRISKKKYPKVDSSLKDRVKDMRDKAKKDLKAALSKYQSGDPASVTEIMEKVSGPLNTLIHVTIAFMQAFAEEKRQKNAIDFVDLEHDALNILVERRPDGTLVPRSAARTYQSYFHEILIDEYQDSNDVQELILRAISGEGLEEDNHENRGKTFNRFMVGDVKQSIYKFRMARPQIFMEKYAAYRPDDPQTERIELDQNFRSRAEVLDSVNEIFARIMRQEVGGIEYTQEVALKSGAVYTAHPDGMNRTELLLVEEPADTEDEENNEISGSSLPSGSSASETGETSVHELNAHQKEALAIAHRIREMVGRMPLRDGDDGKERPARFGDIVVLLRSGAGWNEEFREIFEKAGIPCHVESRTGYFSAGEIRTVMQLLRVLDNPMQDIPLYGTLHGYFGGFSEDEIARFRATFPDGSLYDALKGYAAAEPGGDIFYFSPELSGKCRRFLDFINRWRSRAPFYSVHRLLTGIMDETQYENYCRVLPGGTQRMANLKMFINQASVFEKTSYHGLFQFIRYIDQMHHHDIDYGEANILDEHADVVRIMTIHKSKGLEFPICFVAGLSRSYSFNTHDAAGTLICDSDWGVGVNYMDPETRQKSSTLRKDCIAARIRRESLGEELRILYVAITRAEEKLILTGYMKSPQKLDDWKNSVSLTGEGRLTRSMIEDSGCYLDLIYRALCLSGSADGEGTVDIRCTDSRKLEMEGESEQHTLGERKEKLLGLLNHPSAEPLGDDEEQLWNELDGALSWQYPHRNLQNLYSMTTVSELKHRPQRLQALETEEGEVFIPGLSNETAPASGTAGNPIIDKIPPVSPAAFSGLKTFEASTEGDSRKMDFEPATEGLKQIDSEASTDGSPRMEQDFGQNAAGPLHGSCVHRMMELFDFKNMGGAKAPALTEDGLDQWAEHLFETGKMPAEYRPYVHTEELLPFLASPLAARIKQADEKGRLHREQPFILGLPASKLDRSFPESETILVQGIIDAFFEEDGEIILVDYKTDHVSSANELKQRYEIQLDYYGQALERILEKKVREKILYSFALREEIHLE